jgi:hypothetical protein
MHRITLLAVVATAATLAACDNSGVANPRAIGAASFDRNAGPSSSCSITLPPPVTRPLPAVRETARELNEAFKKPHSSVNCGIVTGISARMNTLVSKLDQPDGEQKLDAACGIAGGLVNQLEELVEQGKLDPIVTHPPEASPNVVENMDFIRSQFCANAGHTSG